jgi:UDP-N-acetylmuramate dehydrogenase
VLESSPDLKKNLRSVREDGEPEIHERVDLRAWTALGIGGLADLLIRCRSADGLSRALDVLATHGQKWLVLGAGSRLVPPDRGLRIPVLNLSGHLGLWELDLDGAIAGAGANLAQLSRAAARTGMMAADQLTMTGSSVGGAVHAAVHGDARIAPFLDWLELARPGRAVERVQLPERRGQQFTLSIDLQRRVVVRARFQLVPNESASASPANVIRRPKRAQRQPRSAEPLFFDPSRGHAEALLAESDCTKIKVGGARLSSRYPNRLCTSKTARAADVLEVTRVIRDQIMERHNVELHPAICFVDEDGVTVSL